MSFTFFREINNLIKIGFDQVVAVVVELPADRSRLQY